MQFELSLVRSGVVDARDFCDALENRLAARPPLGQVAIEEGCLSARQVRDVLRRQRETDSELFGEVAWDLGYLDRDQLARLLMAQTERQRPLIDYLVDLGAISAGDAADAFDTHLVGTGGVAEPCGFSPGATVEPAFA